MKKTKGNKFPFLPMHFPIYIKVEKLFHVIPICFTGKKRSITCIMYIDDGKKCFIHFLCIFGMVFPLDAIQLLLCLFILYNKG